MRSPVQSRLPLPKSLQKQIKAVTMDSMTAFILSCWGLACGQQGLDGFVAIGTGLECDL